MYQTYAGRVINGEIVLLEDVQLPENAECIIIVLDNLSPAKNFIIINGPMGVGKTTVGKKICDMLGRAAFIDGDWCLDIHPFIGNKETKAMAINNILHLTKNYYNCSECDTVILSWIMSENTVNKIISGISDVDFQIYNINLTCSKEALIDRWQKDTVNEWRNNENLNASIKSMDVSAKQNCILIDTSNISADMVAKKIISLTSLQNNE